MKKPYHRMTRSEKWEFTRAENLENSKKSEEKISKKEYKIDENKRKWE
jgi:hypothetical protein